MTAKLAVEKYGDPEVVYCDLSSDEDADNIRFRGDIEKWIGRDITVIRSEKYGSIEEVFDAEGWMSNIYGAPCTVAMKKIPRFNFQQADDLHLFGYTVDEGRRIERFTKNNPELNLEWILRDNRLTKGDCFSLLRKAGIDLPRLYLNGFPNNNCIGCVKATSPRYWQTVRKYAPDVFKRRAEQSRRLGVRLCRLKGNRIFLDELPEENYDQLEMEYISCGPECSDKPVENS